MQFEKCLHCPAIKEKKCSGPYFMAMSTKELVDWATKFQKQYGISNAQLAEWSGIPKSTVDGIKYRDDVRHDTVYRLLKALIEGVGGQWGCEPCLSQSESSERLKNTVDHLEKENAYLRETVEYERNQVKSKRRVIASLTIALGIAICGLVVALFVL